MSCGLVLEGGGVRGAYTATKPFPLAHTASSTKSKLSILIKMYRSQI